MHMIGIAFGVVAMIVAMCVGLLLMLGAISFVFMTASAIIAWTYDLVLCLSGLTSYRSFRGTLHHVFYVGGSGGGQC